MNSKSKWIWYPGDFEIYHALKLNCRREERGFNWPAFWRLDDCWHNVKFRKKGSINESESLNVIGNGIGYLSVDGNKYPYGTQVTLDPGDHLVEIYVAKVDGLPSVYVQAGVFSSNESWQASCLTDEWLPCGCNDMYVSEKDNPEIFKFAYKNLEPVSKKKVEEGILYDFGAETFAKLCFTNIQGQDPLKVFYGESEAEALDTEFSYIYDIVPDKVKVHSFKPRAFKYIYIPQSTTSYNIHAEYEYIPFEQRGSFKSSDVKLNRIWETGAYTFHLNSREFFLDGIKRDRWVWSGDAYQSYLINYYLFFDEDICKRTIIGLRGKDPIQQHINTIMDYSFFWLMSIWDYYQYNKDIDFVRMIYPRMKSMIEFCLHRRNKEGFMSELSGDWVFIDWADIDKTGAVCAEQMLFVKALETMTKCAELMNEDGTQYSVLAKELRKKINDLFWKEELKAYIDSYESGKNNVTRHANIFAIIFDFVDQEKKSAIVKNVFLNERIPKITTPYFKFYELDALCKIGNLKDVYNDIVEYWGGMLDLGATTFWEEYNPKSDFPHHYEMYGDKYGKSLCHAWGASPIYLLGKYFLGVKPTSAGYETFEVAPKLGGLDWIEGKVPIPGGSVDVFMDKSRLYVYCNREGGTVALGDKRLGLNAGKSLEILL